MTKKELIKALENYGDDYEVFVEKLDYDKKIATYQAVIDAWHLHIDFTGIIYFSIN